MKHLLEEPYRLLFAVGLLFGVTGALVWFALSIEGAPVVPALVHPDLMVGGFLWSFAAGFLMTALPRYLGAPKAFVWEVAAALLGSLGMLAGALMADRRPFLLSLLWQQLAVLVFGLRCVRRRRVWPPPVFSFVALGLGCGIAGTSLRLLALQGWLEPRWAIFGRVCLFYGMMPAFVLGVGSGLLTAMFGWKQARLVKIGKPGESKAPWTWAGWREPGALIALFVLGLGLEPFGAPSIGRGLRALCLTWVAFRAWRLYRPARSPGRVVRWSWVAGWAMVLGAWLHAVSHRYAVHFAHALFIMGLGLLALMVASRVALVHGGYGVALERRSGVLTATGLLALLAAIGRVLAPWTGAAYARHLGYAGGLWALALIVWGWRFVPLLVKPRRRLTTAPNRLQSGAFAASGDS